MQYRGRSMTKTSVFHDVADFVNQRNGTRWDHIKAKARYDRSLKKYEEIKREYLWNSDGRNLLIRIRY